MTPLKTEVGWALSSVRAPDRDRDIQCAAFVVQLVAAATSVKAEDIVSTTRHRADASRARHLVMYLTYTALGWPLARVAAAFDRDRSTVSYACQKVEDRRDDPGFDTVLTRLEECVRAAPLGDVDAYGGWR